MEYITFEKRTYEYMIAQLNRIQNHINELYSIEKSMLEDRWIDSTELARRLNIPLTTLQSYRAVGKLGFSKIGHKVYYRVGDIERLVRKSRTNRKNSKKKK